MANRLPYIDHYMLSEIMTDLIIKKDHTAI